MKIFIAGPRAIKKLDKAVENRLHNIFVGNFTVLVGDCIGVDTLIQKYFFDINYNNVTVFASQGIVRNNIGNWNVKTVDVPTKYKGFEFYAKKDEAMVNEADYGFMIWNGESKGTLNNIINLVKQNKKCLVYFTPINDYICVNSQKNLEDLISMCSTNTKLLYNKLFYKNNFVCFQTSLY